MSLRNMKTLRCVKEVACETVCFDIDDISTCDSRLHVAAEYKASTEYFYLLRLTGRSVTCSFIQYYVSNDD